MTNKLSSPKCKNSVSTIKQVAGTWKHKPTKDRHGNKRKINIELNKGTIPPPPSPPKVDRIRHTITIFVRQVHREQEELDSDNIVLLLPNKKKKQTAEVAKQVLKSKENKSPYVGPSLQVCVLRDESFNSRKVNWMRERARESEGGRERIPRKPEQEMIHSGKS